MREHEAPDYARPLMGVREWGVQGHSLTSITDRSGMHAPWHPEEGLVAECSQALRSGIALAYLHREADDPPGRGCSCGIYAYYDLKSKRRLSSYPGYHHRAEGIIAASGRIVLHDRGFRAERASVAALINTGFLGVRLGGEGQSPLEYLAERYGVPIIEEREVERFMEEHGVVLAPKVSPEAEDELSWVTLPGPPAISRLLGAAHGVGVLLSIGLLAFNATPAGSWWGMLAAAAILGILVRERPR